LVPHQPSVISDYTTASYILVHFLNAYEIKGVVRAMKSHQEWRFLIC